MKKEKKVRLFKHQILVTGITVFALVVSIFGSSYAIFTSNTDSGEYNVLQVGNLEISYVDTGAGYGDILSLNGAYPMSDNEGKQTDPYRFYIKNTGSIKADFKIKLKQDESIIEKDGCGENLLDLQYIKVQFDSTGTVYKLSDLLSSDYTLYEKKNLDVGSSEIHEIRIWISSENTPNSVLGKHFHGKVVVESTQAGVDSRYTKEYSIGDAVTLVDGSRWHVLEPSTSNQTTVTLLSDYNLNTNGSYCTTETCPTMAFDGTVTNEDLTTRPARLQENNTYCTDQTNGCNMYEKNNSTVIYDSTLKTWLDTTYKPVLTQSLENVNATLDELFVTIPTMEQIAKADFKTFNQNVVEITNNNFLVTSNYWTRTAYNKNSSSVWYMIRSTNKNDLIYANNSSTVGVRPVITVSKLNVVSE